MIREFANDTEKSEKYVEGVYNASTDYKKIGKIDFENQIYPYLLHEYIEKTTEIKNMLIDTDILRCGKTYNNIYDNTASEFITAVINMFIPALKKEPPEIYVNKEYNYSELGERDDIIGALARLYKNIQDGFVKLDLRTLITFFMCTGVEFKLRKSIPATYAKYMTVYLGYVLPAIIEGLKLDDKPIKGLNKYKFIPAKNAVKKIAPLPDFMKAIPSGSNRITLVIQNIKIEENNLSFNHTMKWSKAVQTMCDCIVYDHCCFTCENKFLYGGFCYDLLFKDCTFYSPFKAYHESFLKNIKFENCKFYNTLLLRKILFEHSVCFENCIFYEDSEFQIDDSKVVIKDRSGVFTSKILATAHKGIIIKNCIFYSPFAIKETIIEKELRIENSAFFDIFDFTNIKFVPEKAVFSNLLFNRGKEVKKYEQILVNVLKEHKLPHIIKHLGLNDEKSRESQVFDYDAYQIAYDSGWLKPEYAAYFLGKSINYLAKMRSADKKMIIRESIPHRTNGRDVQYPIDALMAFKAKDWNKLRELRKKYGYPAKT